MRNSGETPERRAERVKRDHDALLAGRTTGFVKPKRRKIYNNPFIIFAGVAMLIFVATAINRAYRTEDGAVKTPPDNAPYVIYGGRVYTEYDAPIFGEIKADGLTFLLELGEGDTNEYELGALFSVDGYDEKTWLVARFEGKFHLMRCDGNDNRQ